MDERYGAPAILTMKPNYPNFKSPISFPGLWLTAVLAWLLASGLALADGKMFSEKVPTTIPYQRALILHDQGVQILVLQSQYEIPGNAGVKSLGWVVPVPAPPDIASMKARDADHIFMEIDRVSMRKVTRIAPMVFLPLLALALPLAVICLGASLLIRSATSTRRNLRIVGGCSALGFVVLFLSGPLWLRMTKGAGGVETISSQKAGIFDVEVVRAKAANDLLAWLRENSFQFGPEDETTVQAYIDRGWVFVVARIDPSAARDDSRPYSRGLLAPLILRFPSPNPVYPVALTATGGHATEILIYLASNTPMTTDSPLTLRYSGELTSPGSAFSYLIVAEPMEFWESFPDLSILELRHLTKFKATLTPEQMRKDIEFHPDPNAPPYREHLYRW
jgi:hypothetical protein